MRTGLKAGLPLAPGAALGFRFGSIFFNRRCLPPGTAVQIHIGIEWGFACG